MPGAREVQNLQMPHSGTDRVSKYPAVAQGGWAQLELTDALLANLDLLHMQPKTVIAQKCQSLRKLHRIKENCSEKIFSKTYLSSILKGYPLEGPHVCAKLTVALQS